MVYCGPPSKACRQCRRRNIKCDKRRDSCGQCLRAHITCPGYHDPKCLVFRDQTKTVIQRTLGREKPTLPAHIDISVGDRAKQLFLTQYVLGPSCLLNYIPKFYPSGLQDFHLRESIRAVYLAHFSNNVLSTSVLQEARRTYVKALSLTNKALQSKESATKDTMLLTVLLLDLFEWLANNGRNSTAETESRHIDGALALVKVRGREQFKDPVSRRMFLQLSRNVLIRCLQSEVEMPSELISLREIAAQSVDTRDPKWRFSDAMFQYAKLRRAMRTGEWSDDENIRFAMEIDGELVDIHQNMHLDLQAQTTGNYTPSMDVHGDQTHLNSNSSMHMTWNSVWFVRILVNDVVRQCSQRLLSEEKTRSSMLVEQVAATTATILSLSSDICASVPSYTKASSITSQDRETAHTLIFPLYVAASTSVCPQHTHEQIIGALGHIGSVMGIPQAIVAKEMVERGENGNPWGIVAMLRGLPLSDFAWLGAAWCRKTTRFDDASPRSDDA